MKPWLGAAALVTVLAAALAAAAFASTSATGTLSHGGAKRYTLTVHNTGSEAIHCMRFTAAPDVVITTVSGPSGTSQNDASSFGAQDITIAPGASAAWSFTTQADYPTDGGGQLDVSSTCAPGSDVSSPVTGPPPASATPTPPAAKCKCQSLFVRGSHVRTPLIEDKIDLDINLAWTLICTTGTGRCNGTIDVDPPPGFRMRLPRTRPVQCRGKCAKTTGDHFRASMRTDFKKFTPRKRKGRTYVIRIRRTCDGKRIPGAIALEIKFNRNGVADRKRSDLNGDGKPDGD